MKTLKKYIEPRIKICEFDMVDIITASGNGDTLESELEEKGVKNEHIRRGTAKDLKIIP